MMHRWNKLFGGRMKRLNRRSLFLLLLGLLMATFGSAESCDHYPECSTICGKLLECEEDWLDAEDESDMSEEARSQYRNSCMKDCEENSSPSDRECIYEATCSELLDGECSS
jgi:Cys-rich protein (TIGR04453 family)